MFALPCGMKALVIFAFAATVAVQASATPITWQASNVVTGLHDPFHQLSGLAVGTPWSLEITFNPDVPATPAPFASASWACNIFDVGATAVLQLGGFTYTQSGGQAYTNSIHPNGPCRNAAPSLSPPGLIQFLWLGDWTQQIGAWNLNTGMFFAGYYDSIHQDGSLPMAPTVEPGGPFDGIEFTTLPFSFNAIPQQFTAPFQPVAVPVHPAPVPEPATLTMFGTGLAWLARRRLRRR